MQPTPEAENQQPTLHASLLKALRGYNSIPAKELARRSGMSVSTLQSIETGRRSLSAFHIALIAVATGVDPRSFVRGELREWDGQTPYGPGSFNRWLAFGAMRQSKEWLQDLQNLQAEQAAFCKAQKRNEARLYVAFLSARHEMEQTGDAFTAQIKGVEYAKTGG